MKYFKNKFTILKKARKEKWDIFKMIKFYRIAKKNNKNLRFGQIIIHKKVKLTLGNNFIIEGKGSLHIGHDIGSFPRGSISAFRLGNNSHLIINGTFHLLSGHQINIDDNAKIEFNNGVFNHDVVVDCKKYIKFGNNVGIGSQGYIMDSDAHYINGQKKAIEIIIEANVLVGFRTSIMKGTCIRAGSVIAANSVVTKEIPSKCIAAGNPAQVIKENITWDW